MVRRNDRQHRLRGLTLLLFAHSTFKYIYLPALSLYPRLSYIYSTSISVDSVVLASERNNNMLTSTNMLISYFNLH